LYLETTGSGGLEWEILDTGATASQGSGLLNIRNESTGTDILTIDGNNSNVGIGTGDPTDGARLDVRTVGSNRAIYAENNSSGTQTLAVVQDGTGDIADFFGPGGGCSIDTNGNLGCSGSITGGVAWHGRGPSNRPGRIVNASATNAAENRVEDFGSARLKKGAASVTLNSAFAQAITGNRYQVFVTPDGDCKGLYVARKTAHGFDVRELGGGRSTVDFDYRIVAHRSHDDAIPAPANDELAGAVNRHVTRAKAPSVNLVMKDGSM
jgi:hypothetical protein